MSSVRKLKEKLLFEFLGFYVAVKGLALLLHIWDDPGSDVGCCEVFCNFCHSLQTSIGIVYQIRPHIFLSLPCHSVH
jgi:hypothetical protein